MAWFTPDAVEFFRELELNNNKEWFEANKKRYEQSVKKPMEAFAAHMIEQMRKIDPAITMMPKDAVFRIYRDVRFSKDKSPYKTNAGMHVNSARKGDLSRPGLYFHIDARTMGVASGCYMIEPEPLRKMRHYLAANLDEFAKHLGDKRFKEYFGTIRGEANKILPPELREAAAKQPLIFNKQFYYWAEHDPEMVVREDLPDFLIAHVEAAKPMNDFLTKAWA